MSEPPDPELLVRVWHVQVAPATPAGIVRAISEGSPSTIVAAPNVKAALALAEESRALQRASRAYPGNTPMFMTAVECQSPTTCSIVAPIVATVREALDAAREASREAR